MEFKGFNEFEKFTVLQALLFRCLAEPKAYTAQPNAAALDSTFKAK